MGEGKREGAMKVVLLGATGATGRLLARQLVAKKHHVTAIVRNTETEALSGLSADHLKQVRGTVLGMCDESLEQLVQGCDAVLICLGHTISFSGIFGKPRLLVTDTLKKIVKAVDAANKSENKIVKLVLMNSVGVRNKGLEEKHSVGEGILLGLLYFLIPPHKDNVLAADYLTDSIQKDTSCIEWVSVSYLTPAFASRNANATEFCHPLHHQRFD